MYQFLLTIKNENRSNPRTATPKKKIIFGDSRWGYDTCISCGWKEGLGWSEEDSEKWSVKQTIAGSNQKPLCIQCQALNLALQVIFT